MKKKPDTNALIEATIKEAKQAAADAVEALYCWGSELAESPIEKLLLAHLIHPLTLSEFEATIDVLRPPSGLVAHTEPPPMRGLWLYPQIIIGDYRVDFLLRSTMYDKPTHVIVECDGHDFHEKTKEQAARDKARDRYLVSQGYRILRYAGSEIYRDAAQVAHEILCILLDLDIR